MLRLTSVPFALMQFALKAKSCLLVLVLLFDVVQGRQKQTQAKTMYHILMDPSHSATEPLPLLLPSFNSCSKLQLLY